MIGRRDSLINEPVLVRQGIVARQRRFYEMAVEGL